MILDAETLALANAIEALLEDVRRDGEIKPELLESVLEIATEPVPRRAREAGEQLRALRRRRARRRRAPRPDDRLGGHAPVRAAGRTSASSPRRATATCRGAALRRAPGDHLRPARPRRPRRPRQGDPRRQRDARARADPARAVGQLAVLARRATRASPPPRTPIFRAFPRVGIPPRYDDWDDYERRIGFMVDSGVIEDYTYLWYDVRPHPNFGTVEIRAMDAQTRVEHTLALAALIQAMVQGAGRALRGRARRSRRYPYEMLDENKWLAARHGLDGELVDLPERERVPARRSSRGALYDRLREHAAGPRIGRRARRASTTPGPRQRRRAPASSSTRRTTTTTRSCARSWRHRRLTDEPAGRRPSAA